MADFAPVYPGEILLTEFMQPLALSQNGLVPPTWLEDLATADTSWTFDATGLL